MDDMSLSEHLILSWIIARLVWTASRGSINQAQHMQDGDAMDILVYTLTESERDEAARRWNNLFQYNISRLEYLSGD